MLVGGPVSFVTCTYDQISGDFANLHDCQSCKLAKSGVNLSWVLFKSSHTIVPKLGTSRGITARKNTLHTKYARKLRMTFVTNQPFDVFIGGERLYAILLFYFVQYRCPYYTVTLCWVCVWRGSEAFPTIGGCVIWCSSDLEGHELDNSNSFSILSMQVYPWNIHFSPVACWYKLAIRICRDLCSSLSTQVRLLSIASMSLGNRSKCDPRSLFLRSSSSFASGNWNNPWCFSIALLTFRRFTSMTRWYLAAIVWMMIFSLLLNGHVPPRFSAVW